MHLAPVSQQTPASTGSAQKDETIADLAAKALAQADGDVAKASELLEKQARAKTGVWKTLTAPLLASACYDAVRKVCRRDRRDIWTAPNYTPAGNGERVIAHGKSLLDWPLPGGLLLRDATHDDVVRAADFYRAQAQTMAQVAAWLDRIAERVTDGAVGDALDAAALQHLKAVQ